MVVAHPLTSPRRVAVLRALPGLGDLLCAVPALRALRARWPRARVTLLGLPQSGWFVQRFAHLVDDLLPVEGVAGLPEVPPDARHAQRFRTAARQRDFDVAVQAHGSGEVTAALDPWRWAPLDATRHTVVAARPRSTWPDVGAVVAAMDRQLACGTMAA